MSLDVQRQFYFFLLFFFLGIGIRGFYDLFRAFRYLKKHSMKMIHAEDLLYWCIVTKVLISFFLRYTYGEIRGYMLFGILVGICFYQKWICSIISTVISFFRRIPKKYSHKH